MSKASQPRRQAMPRWAWPFVVVSAAVPVVTLGGAIPAAIGGAGAGACIGIARRTAWSVRKRVAMCAVATVATWASVGLLSMAIISTTGGVRYAVNGVQQDPDDYDLDEERGRRKLFADVHKRERRIAESEAALDQARADNFGVKIYEQRLEKAKADHVRHLDFMARFLDVTPAAIEAVMAEGEANGWDRGR